MNAIPQLMEDHQLILRALDALDAFVAKPPRGEEDKAELGRFVRFIREFLFVAMVAAGFPRDGGPIAVMLMDHEAGRAHVSVMAGKAGQAGPWTPQDRATAYAAASGYADLLRGHIAKEDEILYPMAQHRLHEEAMRRVDQECAAFEQKQIAAGGDALKELARELVARHVGIAG
jgi:hemerythrin-like domain-containing protein